MTDKPSFLTRGWAGLKKQYSALGDLHNSKKSASDPEPWESKRYSELSAWMKIDDSQMDERHERWRTVYDDAYAAAYDKYKIDGMKDAGAKRKSNQRALEAVCESYPDEVKSSRGVAKALSGK